MLVSCLFSRAASARVSLRRNYSGSPPKQASPHIAIYKEFGRPFAKVFLMAVFTYQTLYWGWLKMEKDDEKRTKNAEIAKLEDEVAKLRPLVAK
ncbi:hypothetical protein FN846DRAFT_978745 [Sphaerosporella brunnea]|uniref:Inner membrane assembly complex subunit 17 n=1 Tax=Sphaerosporella brunnea TaxID=1250544 RepID=A0A5J5EES6_9PEZI|nr:hypothetical protein FN846DRAFT_978745 [Sphaerosporella brunnea]